MNVGLVLREVSVKVLEFGGEMLFEMLLAQDYSVFCEDLYLELVEASWHLLGGKAMLFLELDQADNQKKQPQGIVFHSQQAFNDVSVFLLVDYRLIAYVFVYFRQILEQHALS